MAVVIEVDKSFFTFPDGWIVEQPDEWAEQKRLTGAPFHAKGCDLAALGPDPRELWLIEAKDYTYPGAKVPDDLADTVGLKVLHTLAILHAVAHWGDSDHRNFSRRATRAATAKICLAVELPDGGRRLMGVQTPLANLQAKLKKVTRRLNVPQPVVSNSYLGGSVPWSVRRNPVHKALHKDR